MTKTISLLGVLALTAGCSMMKGKGDDTGGGGGGGGGAGMAGNMAEAPTHSIGDTVNAAAECHTTGYMKVDAPAGEAFQIALTIEGPEGACVDLSYLNANGGAENGGQMFGELCESKTVDVVGLEGGSYITVSETGVCKGATVSIALQ